MTFRVLKTRGIEWKTVKINYAQKPYPKHAPPLAKASSKVVNSIIVIIVLISPYFLKRKIGGSAIGRRVSILKGKENSKDYFAKLSEDRKDLGLRELNI